VEKHKWPLVAEAVEVKLTPSEEHYAELDNLAKKMAEGIKD